MDILKLWSRGTAEEDDPQTEFNPDDHAGEGLESDLMLLIVQQLARGGIAEECVSIDIRNLGRGADGREVYAGMLRLAKWEQKSAVRLLLGLPLLQAKVRKALRGSWMHDVSHFAGLWLHPSGQFEETGSLSGLRNLILRVEELQLHSPESDNGMSVWSLPGELSQHGELK